MAIKYTFKDGLIKKKDKNTTVANPAKALTIISSNEDIKLVSKLLQKKSGTPLEDSELAQYAKTTMLNEEYVAQFHTSHVLDYQLLFDELTQLLHRYEIPIGFIYKLLELSSSELNFIIDDNWTMGTSYLNTKSKDKKKSRWQEVSRRLHIFVNILAYIPITINISFLNRTQAIRLSNFGKTPQQFTQEAHDAIRSAFLIQPSGRGSPIHKTLATALRTRSKQMMHYLFTSEAPTDCFTSDIKNLIKCRRNAKANPITLINCDQKTTASKWMQEVEQEASFTHVCDDFIKEREAVLKQQGSAFPFSEGIWLMKQLFGINNPHDLCGLDNKCPLSIQTLNNFLGRKLTDQEYLHYLVNHPNNANHRHEYLQLSKQDIFDNRTQSTPLVKHVTLTAPKTKHPSPYRSFSHNKLYSQHSLSKQPIEPYTNYSDQTTAGNSHNFYSPRQSTSQLVPHQLQTPSAPPLEPLVNSEYGIDNLKQIATGYKDKRYEEETNHTPTHNLYPLL